MTIRASGDGWGNINRRSDRSPARHPGNGQSLNEHLRWQATALPKDNQISPIRKIANRAPLLCLLILLGCGRGEITTIRDSSLDTAVSERPDREGHTASIFLPEDGPSEETYPELQNLMQITENVYSGAEPKTEAAFKQLADLGVRVIVSVDGAKPKVDFANRYGMRYVHIPIGYDGLDAEAVRSFARAADELDETTYVHCHHGKHRGPAGAAAICTARGNVRGEQALRILEKAGTSRGYVGLWRDVRNYRCPSVDEPLPELVSAKAVSSIAAAMAQIDRASENLKLCKKADWSTPANHPDFSPSHAALLLKEGFHELNRQLAENNEYDEKFFLWMKESEESAIQLEAALQLRDTVKIRQSFDTIQSRCSSCHEAYRN